MKGTILITGANKGIGFETARQLGQRGYFIILTGRNENKIKQSLAELKKESINANALLIDVSNAQSIKKAADEISKRNYKLDVLINNAAVLYKNDKSILQNNNILIETIITNSIGPLMLIKEFLSCMNSPSRIINVSSGGGSMTDPVGGWAPAYCVSKTLLNSITRQLAEELKPKNISVNAVCPGWVQTDMGGKNAPRSVEKGAETIVWLAAKAAHNITGKFFRDKKQIPW
jgi:NAD(P)-dependent dehydrogenase (short-subunit alcohol dehydrogenase family)